jgi:quercetin dioxygenase-like cupin family protein
MNDTFAQFDLPQEIHDAESRKPWRSGLHSQMLVKNDDLGVILFAMEPGATLKEHHAGGSITVHVLQGEIRFRTPDRDCLLRTGQMLTLGRSIKHTVESVGDSAFLLTISWPRTQEQPARRDEISG